MVQAQANRLYDQGKQVVNEQVHKLGSRNGNAEVDPDGGEEAGGRRLPATLPANAF